MRTPCPSLRPYRLDAVGCPSFEKGDCAPVIVGMYGPPISMSHPEPKMINPRVTLDADSLGPVERKLQKPLEQQLTSALQQATHSVDDNYQGESVDEVAQELLEETKDGLHPDIAAGFTPDGAQLHAVATAIVDEHR